MEGSAVEEGIEVDGVDAEVGEVVEFVEDALEVAAVTAVENRFKEGFAGFPGGVSFIPLVSPWGEFPCGGDGVGEFEGIVGGVVAGVAVAEAFGEDLIPDGVLSPLGDVGGGVLGSHFFWGF